MISETYDIRDFIRKQKRNQEFSRAGEVSWNRSTSINVSGTTYKKKGKNLGVYTLKTSF